MIRLFASTSCTPDPEVFGIPTWYKYLEGTTDPISGKCIPFGDVTGGLDSLTGKSAAAIGLAVIEILLRLVLYTAIIWVVYGGFQYLISQGEPDRVKAARETVINAVIGVIVAAMASTIVVFIGSRLQA